MKKHLWIFAAAAVALAACSNDDTIATNQGFEDANAISFRPIVNNLSRAQDASFSTAGDKFKATAFAQGTTEDAYFAGVEFTASGTPVTFNSETKYYWPSGKNLDFYAWAPSDIENATYESIPVTVATAAADQIDFVYAATKDWGKVALQTGTDASHTITTAATSGVTINFRHALSKIVINLRNSNANVKVTASNVTLKNVYGAGTFAYAGTNTDIQNSALLDAGYWTTTGDATAVYSQDITPAVFSTAAAAGTDLKLIPQSITGATAYANSGTPAVGNEFTAPCIAVKLKIQNSGDDSYIIGAALGNNEYVEAIFPLPTITAGWEPGKQYIYTVDLAEGGYSPTNTDTNEDLDPILENAVIKFVTVTVDDWSTPAIATEVGMLP